MSPISLRRLGDNATLWSHPVDADVDASRLADALWAEMPAPLKEAVDSGQVNRFFLLTAIAAILQRKNGYQDLAPGLALFYRP